MTAEEIYALIIGDVSAAALAAAGNDSGCAARLKVIAPKVPRPTLLGELGILALFADPNDGEACMVALEAAAAAIPLVARALKSIQPAAQGLDFGDPRIRAMLSQLQAGGFLTEPQLQTLLSGGEGPAEISVDEVSAAMYPHRERTPDTTGEE